MKTKHLYSLLFCISLVAALLSCGSDDDDDDKTNCETFSKADSVCFCTANPDDLHCVTFSSFTVSLYSEEDAPLTPFPGNSTLWSKGFEIDNVIYLIDRESESPHAFWGFDVVENDTWSELADFPGTKYGLTGAANGKGYASSYASSKFWEYDPGENKWTPMTDLPFAPGETHWVEYQGKFYVPNHNGIYEFNATTKEWKKYSEQTSTGFGGVMLIGDDMYWWDINNDYMSHFDLASKAFAEHDLPEDFGSSIVFNSPFVLGSTAYIVQSSALWIFNNDSKTWTVKEDGLEAGSAYPDDAFVIDDKAFLAENGYLKVFEGVTE